MKSRIGYRPRGTPPRIVYDEAICPNPQLPGPCHIFRGAKGGGRPGEGRYGCVRINGKTVAAHRYAWEQKHGPIPGGMVIDHRCRVRSCVNVEHPRIVTPAVNATENSSTFSAVNKAKTHCPAGHAYDEANTYRYPSGGRGCRACRKTSVSRRSR